MYLERQMNILSDKELKYIFHCRFPFFLNPVWKLPILVLAMSTEHRKSSYINVFGDDREIPPPRKKAKRGFIIQY